MRNAGNLAILARGGTADLTVYVESKLEGKKGGIFWDTRSGMTGTARDARTAHS